MQGINLRNYIDLGRHLALLFEPQVCAPQTYFDAIHGLMTGLDSCGLQRTKRVALGLSLITSLPRNRRGMIGRAAVAQLKAKLDPIEATLYAEADAAMRGEMTVTFTLTDTGVGTDVLAVHDKLPPGVSPVDNEAGWREALNKLAAFVEAGQGE